jgi:16S rRNA (guanine527-N7)-methyltransferase
MDIEQVWVNHIFPSLLANVLLPFPLGVAVLDLGSGGGLPGMPLKIIRPDLKVVLLDSSQKKTAFLRMVVIKLDIPGVEIVTTRISPPAAKEKLTGRFRVITARAVANFENLIECSESLLGPAGYLLAWKGESDLAELQRSVLDKAVHYEIVRVPEIYWPISGKFEQLCFVKLFFNASTVNTATGNN